MDEELVDSEWFQLVRDDFVEISFKKAHEPRTSFPRPPFWCREIFRCFTRLPEPKAARPKFPNSDGWHQIQWYLKVCSTQEQLPVFECLSSRISCLQRWLHRNNQKHFDAQMLLHTNAFTHKRFYAQTLWDTPTSKTHKKNSVFDTRTSFRAKRLPPDQPNSQKTLRVQPWNHGAWTVEPWAVELWKPWTVHTIE